MRHIRCNPIKNDICEKIKVELDMNLLIDDYSSSCHYYPVKNIRGIAEQRLFFSLWFALDLVIHVPSYMCVNISIQVCCSTLKKQVDMLQSVDV
jgi:hypothetical protein